ncbi:hypothetical protein BP5796_11905 [Coleophoma crateriformis]|uniref:S-adenosyl-L-methionine-dependent methyltransferase n=1 Tax=Coleophoma crateriformis TaxID=565419 RepID=A0A3D8QEQ1_9HELO|nr:hypothetical protein BP5796_11905 [Coleophoma crateriformis]
MAFASSEDNKPALTPPDRIQHPISGDKEIKEHPLPMCFTSLSATDLEVDFDLSETNNSDSDSAIETSDDVLTISAQSRHCDGLEQNARTYHRFKEGKYHLPNDEVEKNRLDLQHHLCCLAFESHYLAPIENLNVGLHNVLDFATGTGIWATEFAAQFPDVVVVGTDLSPIQPEHVPANCHFEVEDAEDTWNFAEKFDYIHGRMLVTCFQSHLKVFGSAFDSLRSGGYIELQDVSFPFLGADDRWNGSAFQHWMKLLMDGSKALGKDWNRVPRYKGYLEELGFVDVVERRFNCPLGTWAKGKKNKILGTWGRENILSGLGALSMVVLTKGLGMTAAEIELLLVDVRNDINKDGEQSIHLYAPMFVVYGRKP